VVTVDKKFEYWAFHTIEYKMLPVSQKINTVEDINVKRYCTNCGAKLGKGDKFCSSCGTKA
jgi:rRNA maturation endonuclease Nob1